ncbi:S8 family serine peptidase [Larkinella sp. GY13]|uniref:S8 family peptidase n=1 Tax=Larkinella sp. GY13 TaxID=3453720 RepID=UPI003EEBEB1D
MPAHYPIFSTSLSAYRPVIWLAQPVYTRYNQLRDLLRNRLGESYAQLLAEPLIPPPYEQTRTEARWFSDSFRQGTPLPNLIPPDRARVSQLLDAQLSAIRQLADELERTSQTENQQLGTLLRLAIEIPGPECVLTNGDQAVLVLWGFESDRSRQERFRVNQYLKHQIPEPPAVPPGVPLATSTNPVPPSNPTPPPVSVQSVADTVKTRRWWWDWRWPRWFWWRRQTDGPVGCGCIGWLLGLLLLLLLLGLLYWFWPAQWGRPVGVGVPGVETGAGEMPESGRTLSPHLPDRPQGIVAPVDSAQIITNPKDSLQRPIIGNRLNVFLKKEVNLVAFVNKVKASYTDNELQIVAFDTTLNALQVQIPTDQRDVWRDRLQKMPEVYLVFDESLFQSSSLPNDPDLANRTKNWYFEAIGAFEAWNITRGSDQVTVAVLDGGFDTGHPELQNQIVQARNMTAESGKINTDSPMGGRHGTHVAATVAGRAGNAAGTSGIAPNCRVMAVQVGTDKPSTLAIVFGLQYAIKNGARVISLSLGRSIPAAAAAKLAAMPEARQNALLTSYQQSPAYQTERQLFETLFGEASRNGVVIVKATGNENIPAGFDPMNDTPYTINVSADGPPNQAGKVERASFSNYGPLSTVSAPGVQIYNAVPGGGYDYMSGTSMATPIVAGGVALMCSLRPDLSPDRIRAILVKTGNPHLGGSGKHIGPLIQLHKALEACRLEPKDACAATLDSLKREIAKLKRQP